MARAPRSETSPKPRAARAAPKAEPAVETAAVASVSPPAPAARKTRGTAAGRRGATSPRMSASKATAGKPARGQTAGNKTVGSAAAKSNGAAPKRGRAATTGARAGTRRSAGNGESSADINLGYLNGFVGFHLRLAQDASYRVFSKHRDKDLVKPGRFTALAIIQLNPGISQSALGRAIARDKSTVSPLIKDLQKNGFINRKASTNDKRSVTLALTKKGERTLMKLQARATEHENELDRLIGPSKPRFVNMLEKIVAGMTAQAPA